MIESILDNDLYKFSMQKAVLDYKTEVPVKYSFFNRRKEAKFNNSFLNALQQEIRLMETLRLTSNEKKWLRKSCPWLGDKYIDYLSNYRYDKDEVKISLNNNELELEIEGTWEHSILWEVPLMALISELYFIHCDSNWDWNENDQISKIEQKAVKLKNSRYSDFGTRRRRSFKTQDFVVKHLKNYTNNNNVGFFGTSNVYLAMRYDVRPIGTMAHEWIMGVSAIEGLFRANYHALRIWSECYNGNLGIALTDTFGTKAFFKDFDGYQARLFDGVRHDSGSPYDFADRVIDHYKSLGINPLTKSIVFSDGLNADLASKIADYCDQKIMCSFGIGTNFTNDFDGSEALNMVIKLIKCNGFDVVKLSDDLRKSIGEKDALRVAKWLFFGQPLDK